MQNQLLSTRHQSRHAFYEHDHLGNKVQIGINALLAINLPIPSDEEISSSLYAYELAMALEQLDVDWIDLHELVGGKQLMVKINIKNFQTFTYQNGVFALVSCADAKAFSQRVAYEHKLYKLREEGYTLIEERGISRIFDHQRMMFIE